MMIEKNKHEINNEVTPLQTYVLNACVCSDQHQKEFTPINQSVK